MIDTDQPKWYTVGGRRFRQDKLVLGQVAHLGAVLKGLTFDLDRLDVGTLLLTLGDRLPKALACVLIEEGKTAGDVVEELDAHPDEGPTASFLRRHLDWVTGSEMVSDFFIANPVTIVPRWLAALNAIWAGGLTPAMTPSNASSPSWRAETSAGATSSARA